MVVAVELGEFLELAIHPEYGFLILASNPSVVSGILRITTEKQEI